MDNQNLYINEASKLIPAELKAGYQFVELYTYTTTDGAPNYWRFRIESANDKKILPMHKSNDGIFVLKEPDFNGNKKPLYRLHELASNQVDVVYVVEGEKCVDQLRALGLLATTSGGASSANTTNWLPLSERTVIIWRDADDAGLKYAQDVTKILLQLDCSVGWIDVEKLGMSNGCDCVDYLMDHANSTKECVQRLTAIDMPGAVEHVANNYPNFKVKEDGVYYCKEQTDSVWLSSRLVVKALTRDADGVNWGRVLEITDADDVVRCWTMPMELLGGNGDELARELLRLGLRISPGVSVRKLLVEYITNSETNQRARCVLKTGWHDRCFVLPHKVIGSSNETVLLQSDSQITTDYASSNDLLDWQTHVASLCVGNSRLIFAVSLAFAAPLLKIVRAESGGFHFRGESSTGKTTALTVAASVWGGKNYIQNWRATDNGLEGLAVQHNDTLLLLDELSQIDPKYAGEVAYMLANGQGKVRASKSGAVRQRYAWQLLFLSSGEISLASHMLEAGKKSKAGQEVRMIDIPADAGKRRGIFEALHSFSDGAIFSERLKINCDKHHGIASEAFLERLVADDSLTLHVKIQAIQSEFMSSLPRECHGQVKRVAQRFALIAAAGELAIEYGVTGWQKGVAIQAVTTCFGAWLSARDGGIDSHENEKIMAHVRHFFQENESRFDVFDSVEKHLTRMIPHKCAGFVTDNGDFYVFPKTFSDEICKGIGAKKEVAEIVEACGWLLPGEKNKSYSSVWVPTKCATVRLYHFSSRVIGEGKNTKT